MVIFIAARLSLHLNRLANLCRQLPVTWHKPRHRHSPHHL